MRIGISIWSIPGGAEGTRPLAECMAEAADAGFEAIELAVAEQGVLSVTTGRAECDRIRAAAEKYHLALETVASGMSWSVNPTHAERTIRARAVQLHARALERTAWLGATALLYVPGAITIPWDASFPPVSYDDAVHWAAEGVQALIPLAERLQVDLCIENVWNGLFYSPLEFARFLDEARSPRVGAYFDCGNVLGYHQHPEHWIRILRQRIRRVHVKDFRRSVGTLAGFCDLGAGDVRFPEVMDALRDIGYDATLIAEMMPPRPGLLAETRAALERIRVASARPAPAVPGRT